jgi:hypothetical protein
MRKLFSHIIIAVTLIILISSPGSAEMTKISPGDIIYIGESGLDLTDFIKQPTIVIAEFRDMYGDTYVNSYKITKPISFYVSKDDFIGKTGKWYLSDDSGKGQLAFIVREPSINLKIFDTTTQKDVTNEPVPRGHYLNFKVETNIGLASQRSGYNPDQAPFYLTIKNPTGKEITDEVIGNDDLLIPLYNLPITTGSTEDDWYWVSSDEDHAEPSVNDGWNTGAMEESGQYVYDTGEYSVWVVCVLNDMNKNYLAPSDGSLYTGKTISVEKKITLYDSNLNELPSDSSSMEDNTAKISRKESIDTKDYRQYTGTGSL